MMFNSVVRDMALPFQSVVECRPNVDGVDARQTFLIIGFSAEFSDDEDRHLLDLRSKRDLTEN